MVGVVSFGLEWNRLDWNRTDSSLLFILYFFAYFFAASIIHKVTVGTQAAVLAGLDITMFIEFNPPHNAEWVGDHFPVVRRAMS